MVSLNENVTFIKEDDALVLLDFQNGDYYKVTGIAVDILIILENAEATKEQIIKDLASKYDAPLLEVINEVEKSIYLLSGEGIIHVDF